MFSIRVKELFAYSIAKKKKKLKNFKTKPPDDEWSTPCDRALQNTAFVKKKIMRAPPCVGAFQKNPDENESINY